MSDREVAITGVGLLTPLGANVEENWYGVTRQRTGIARHTSVAEGIAGRYLGRVESVGSFDIPGKLQSQMRFLNRGSLLGFGAAYEAMSSCAVSKNDVPDDRRALYIASGDFTKVGYEFMYPAIKGAADPRWEALDLERLNTGIFENVNPFFLLESIPNNLFSFLSAFFGIMGPNTSLASLSPCGAHALELAYQTIRDDRADMALVVGCGNWITDVPLYEMDGLGILSKCRQGAQSYRPFDRCRDGFIPGEGGAALVLEPSNAAIRRGAKILAHIRGFGNCIEMPAGERLSIPQRVSEASMHDALEEASCDPQDLAFICPHGSGTPKGDRSELESIMSVLGENPTEVPVCGLKPYTGHMAAASDIAEIVLAMKAVSFGIVPATLNFIDSDPQFHDLCILNSHQHTDKRVFLSTSYGIMSQCSSTVIETVAA